MYCHQDQEGDIKLRLLLRDHSIYGKYISKEVWKLETNLKSTCVKSQLYKIWVNLKTSQARLTKTKGDCQSIDPLYKTQIHEASLLVV